LGRLYSAPHDHARWVDHRIRVAVSVAFAQSICGRPKVAADLSCGDAAIITGIGPVTAILGDYAPRYPIVGPIERTITEIPDVDLWVCCETVEHLDDPDKVLAAGRERAAHLLLSTPVDAFVDHNPEHYWAWDRDAVEDMLVGAGWLPNLYAELDMRPAGGAYSFGLWWCR
jgi:hypothetical protein